MDLILIVKALAGTLVKVPSKAPTPPRNWGGTCSYARYASECTLTVYSTKYDHYGRGQQMKMLISKLESFDHSGSFAGQNSHYKLNQL